MISVLLTVRRITDEFSDILCLLERLSVKETSLFTLMEYKLVE